MHLALLRSSDAWPQAAVSAVKQNQQKHLMLRNGMIATWPGALKLTASLGQATDHAAAVPVRDRLQQMAQRAFNVYGPGSTQTLKTPEGRPRTTPRPCR